MAIKDMDDREKSLALATMMKLRRFQHAFRFDDTVLFDDFYAPENMALAWRVLAWAYKRREWYDYSHAGRLDNIQDRSGWMQDILYAVLFSDDDFFLLPPVDAQRRWLDMVLTLALETGLDSPPILDLYDGIEAGLVEGGGE